MLSGAAFLSALEEYRMYGAVYRRMVRSRKNRDPRIPHGTRIMKMPPRIHLKEKTAVLPVPSQGTEKVRW